MLNALAPIEAPKRLTKKQKKLLRQQGVEITSSFQLKRVKPLTDNQERAFRSYFQGKNLMLHGTAGTGKTFSALYLALRDVQLENYDRVAVFRSIVPSRDIGFLPGNTKEKTRIYETPYHSLCAELYERDDAYDVLKNKNYIDFIPTSYIRGITIDNAIFIIDEVQNMIWQEINTILTRVGDNCRVIICGDTKQSDLTERNGKEDLNKLIKVCQQINNFDFIEMTKEDIVRSGFVKDFIVQCEELGY